MDEQAEFSVLSKASYDYFHGGEALANSELREYGLDYTIDLELSDSRAVVITRSDGSAVVSYRGTDHVSDLVPDFQIAMGYHSNPLYQRVGAVAAHVVTDRFADARDRYARAKKKHGSDVSVTGHSLGGSLALHTARAHGGKAVVFNPGSSPLAEPFHAAYCTAFDCGYAERARIYSTGRDPISLSSYIFDQATDDVVKVAPKDGGDYFAHGLVHFLPRRRAGVHPTYLDPVDTVGGGVVPFCVVFPELCPVGS